VLEAGRQHILVHTLRKPGEPSMIPHCPFFILKKTTHLLFKLDWVRMLHIQK